MALDEATLRYLANRQRVMYPADPPGYVRPRHTEGLAPTRAIMPSPSRPQGLGETTLADEMPLDIGNFRPESTMRSPEMAVQGPPPGTPMRQEAVRAAPMRQEAVEAPPGTAPPQSADGGGDWFPSSQAGWAGANSAIAPLLGDWRTTPAQVIAAALGGYGQGKYAADQDQAQQQQRDELLNLQKAQLLFEAQGQQRKAAQQQMLMDEIATIEDPNERKIAMLDPEGYAKAKADQMFAPPPDPVRLGAGETLFDPATGQQIAQGPAKTERFGDSTIGYFSMGPDGVPQQIIPGLGREPRAPQKPDIFGSEAMGYFSLGADGKPQPLVAGLGRASSDTEIAKLYAGMDAEQDPSRKAAYQAKINSLMKGSGGSETELGKLYGEMDQLRPDDPRRSSYQAKIDSMLKGRGGVRFTTASGDTFEMGGEGGGGTMDLSQPNLNKAQESVIATQDQMSRIENLSQDFKPEYFQYGPRVRAGITAGMEKLGRETSPEAQKQLIDSTAYRSSVINNTNQIVKEQSGLTMNESEAARIQMEAPSDTDSPSQFVAKMQSTQKRLKANEIRKKLLLQQGIQFDAKKPGAPGGIELDDVPQALNQMGARLEQDLIAQGLSPEQAAQETAKRLKQMLGL